MARYFRIKNYDKYQLHRNKNPKWVAVYNTLWTDPDFFGLDPHAKLLYIGLLNLASQHEQRLVLDNPKWISATLQLPIEIVNLEPLIAAGFLIESAQNCADLRKSDQACAESDQVCADSDKSDQTPANLSLIEREIERDKEKEKKTGEINSAREDRATKLPDNFQLTEEMAVFAFRLILDARKEFGGFYDYHVAKGSRFVDWVRAWQTWCRRAVDHRERWHQDTPRSPPPGGWPPTDDPVERARRRVDAERLENIAKQRSLLDGCPNFGRVQ